MGGVNYYSGGDFAPGTQSGAKAIGQQRAAVETPQGSTATKFKLTSDQPRGYVQRPYETAPGGVWSQPASQLESSFCLFPINKNRNCFLDWAARRLRSRRGKKQWSLPGWLRARVKTTPARLDRLQVSISVSWLWRMEQALWCSEYGMPPMRSTGSR